jgi:hypothetical protein
MLFALWSQWYKDVWSSHCRFILGLSSLLSSSPFFCLEPSYHHVPIPGPARTPPRISMLMEQNEAVNGGQQQLSTVCQQPCERPSDRRAVQSRPALFLCFALSLALDPDHPCAPRSSGSRSYAFRPSTHRGLFLRCILSYQTSGDYHGRRCTITYSMPCAACEMERTDGRTTRSTKKKPTEVGAPPDSIYVYACCARSEGGKGRKI